MTTTTFILNEYNPVPTKKDIIERLFKAGHIDFTEMWLLILDESEVKYIPMPQVNPNPWELQPWEQPYTITTTDGTGTTIIYNGKGGAGNSELSKAQSGDDRFCS